MSDHLTLVEQRRKLLETLERQGISDPRVLEALERLPREAFVPPDRWSTAYENHAMPIGFEQTISQPYIVALMTESLQLQGNERVLEIGTGSGYQCGILALLSGHVYTVERIPELSIRAKDVLDRLRITNVSYRVGDGSHGWPEEAPFDRIIVTATAPDVPQSIHDQLAEGGILVMPVGVGDSQQLRAYQKREGRLHWKHLCDCRFVPLIGEEAWEE